MKICEKCGRDDAEVQADGMRLVRVRVGNGETVMCEWCAEEHAEYEADALR
jgi:protein-arginine kinase activator protein McsA